MNRYNRNKVKVLPAYTPTCISPILTSKEYIKTLRLETAPESATTTDLLDILKDHLCDSMLDTNATFTGTSSEKFSELGYGVYSIGVSADLSNTLQSGDNIRVGFNNFPNFFKVIAVYSNSLYVKVMDEDYRVNPSHPLPNSAFDDRIYKFKFNWEMLSFQKGKHICVRPKASNKKNCLLLLAIDADNKDDATLFYDPKTWSIYAPQGQQATLPAYTINTRDYGVLLAFHLSDWIGTKSVKENIDLFRVSVTEGQFISNADINYAFLSVTPFVQNTGSNKSSSNISTGNWFLYGDARYFYFAQEIKSNSGINVSYYSVGIAFGEFENYFGDTSFVMSASINTWRKALGITNSYLPFVGSEQNVKTTVTHPNNDKECFFVKTSSSSSTSITSLTPYNIAFQVYTSSIYYSPTFEYLATQDLLNIKPLGNNYYTPYVPIKSPVLFYSSKQNSSMSVKNISNEYYFVTPNASYAQAMPLTYSFR